MYQFQFKSVVAFIFLITNKAHFVYSSPNPQVSVNVHFIPSIYSAPCRFARIWNPPELQCASCFCMSGQYSRCIPRLFCNPHNFTSITQHHNNKSSTTERIPENVMATQNEISIQNIPVYLTTTTTERDSSTSDDDVTLTVSKSTTTEKLEATTSKTTASTTTTTTVKGLETSETPVISTSKIPMETSTTTTQELTSSTSEIESTTWTTSTERIVMSSGSTNDENLETDLVTTTTNTVSTTELLLVNEDNRNNSSETDSNDSTTIPSLNRRVPRL